MVTDFIYTYKAKKTMTTYLLTLGPNLEPLRRKQSSSKLIGKLSWSRLVMNRVKKVMNNQDLTGWS